MARLLINLFVCIFLLEAIALAQQPFSNIYPNFHGNLFTATNMPITASSTYILSVTNNPGGLGDSLQYDGSSHLFWGISPLAAGTRLYVINAPTNNRMFLQYDGSNLYWGLLTNTLAQSQQITVTNNPSVTGSLLQYQSLNKAAWLVATQLVATVTNIYYEATLNGTNVAWGFVNDNGTNRFKIVGGANEIYFDFIP